MRKFIYLAIFSLLAMWGCSSPEVQTASYEVIPRPQVVEPDTAAQGFLLTGKTKIACPAELATEAALLKGYIETLTGHNLKVTDSKPEKNAIILRADLEGDNLEGYEIAISADSIVINGSTPAGTFYGIQTLRKSIPEAKKSDVLFPAANIADAPRFAYRGAHFDVSRHFFPSDSVKTFIDMLALHNINTFHWHLTDDQGWRVEIKSRPRLTEVGSKRPGSIIGHTTEYDSIPVEGFYTQDEIRDIIKYAADRHITVIPEIDLPGHMLAALSAYPELGCTGGPYEVWQRWGVSEDVLCAGNDSTYKFLDEVLGEIADLFPSEYIHIGGDECPKVRWEACEKCQAKIVELGLKSDENSTKEQKLQGHVMAHANEFLASKGKKVIGWDETLEGGLAPGAVVMSWRGESGGLEASRQGHDAIMTPHIYLYFDYYQTLDQENEPVAIGGYLPLEKVYGYEPITENYTPEQAEHIIGVQANLWTEYISTFSHAQYMELPRMAALSEVQWSTAPKDYDAFIGRIPQMLNHYKANGYNFSTRAFDIQSEITTDPESHNVVIGLSTVDNAPIRFTTDGSEPDEQSQEYTEPIRLDKSTMVKAKAFRAMGPSRTYSDSIAFNKATAQKISLLEEPNKRYAAQGAPTLVNGKKGGKSYSSAGWIAFNGNDGIAVIEFDKPEKISKVASRSVVNTEAYVFDARAMKVELSDDSKTWRTVASEQYPALEQATNGIFDHALQFPENEAKFVKITFNSEKNIPQWHPGKGNTGFLFLDEIEIN